MADEQDRPSDTPPPEGDDQNALRGRGDGSGIERHSIEEEVEEILREKGEEPGRAYRPEPKRYPSLGPMSPGLMQALQGVLVLALGTVLLFVAFRVMGPAGFRFGAMGLLIFLAFYAMRPIISEFLRRRRA